MRVQTLLNHCHPLQSFIYTPCRLEQRKHRQNIVVRIEPRKNGKIYGSECGKPCPGYDHLDTREFDFVPLWNIPVLLEYRMRRVDGPQCGVRVAQIPWAEGKSHTTKAFELCLTQWARKWSGSETAKSFGTCWDTVYRSVKGIVAYGLAHRHLDGITAIGVDEIQYGKGTKDLTVVYQIDAGVRRLIDVGKERTTQTLQQFFHGWGEARTALLQLICSDLWPPYLTGIQQRAPQALNILDRFPIVSKDVLEYDLKSVRAYLLKESVQLFWGYDSSYWAEWYLNPWCNRAMRSRLEPIKKFVRTIRAHQPLIMNWFKAKKAYSSGVVEGLNRKINLVTRKAFGFRSYEVLQIARFHTMGGLPEPKYAHKFCG